MVSPQTLSLATIALLFSILAGLFRFYLLGLTRVYPSIIFFFSCEFAIVAASTVFGVSTDAYAYFFIILLPLEWFAFCYVMRDLYAAVFVRYRGIEALGRWSVYAALFVTCALAIAGELSTRPTRLPQQTALVGIEFASGCIIFGSVVLVLLILFAISRYPLELHKNVVVNCRFFALYMLVDAGVLLTSQFAGRQHTLALNIASALLSACILLTWPLFVTREGEVIIVNRRRRIDPREAARLLEQLNAFNNLLLRVAKR